MTENKYKKSLELYGEAEKISPMGYQAPQNPYFYGIGNSPAFLSGGRGCKAWDPDGNEYIDFLCGLGAIVLGMRHPKVEEAVKKQMEKGDCMTFPSERWVDLARLLVGRIPGMDWAIFAKNGSDVTSYMAQVARAYTGRPGIARIEHAYHGFHYWHESPCPAIPEEYQKHVYDIKFNDLSSFKKVVDDNRGELAAVILTPVRHDIASDQELPEDGFFKGIREVCDKEGMLVLVDDIRCGFRYHPDGSAAYFGLDADMIAFGKAMSNGYPISAAMGKKELMDAARSFLFIGTHFYSAAPMAAAIACLTELKESGAVDHMKQMGELLRKGMTDAAKEHGFSVRHTGHPAMPLMLFDDDPIFEKSKRFAALAMERGILLHPIHNWFISAAHQKEDIEKAVEVTEQCLKVMASE